MNIKQLVTHACSLSAIFAASSAGLACNQADPVGDLTVPFEIGAGIECSLKNVVDVEVTLLELKSGDAEDIEVESAKVPCGEGKAEFDNVPVGTYGISVKGYDADNVVVVDNDGSAEAVGEVLEGKESTAATINLTSTPAQLWIRFALSKDMFQTMCSQIPLTELAITAFKNDGGDPLLSVNLACDASPTEGTYHRLADPMRDLDGAVFDYVRVQPRDAAGQVIGADVKYPLAEVPGPGRIVKLTFGAECDDTKCDLACTGGSCTQD